MMTTAVLLILLTGQILVCDRALFEVGQVSCFQRCAARDACPGLPPIGTLRRSTAKTISTTSRNHSRRSSFPITRAATRRSSPVLHIHALDQPRLHHLTILADDRVACSAARERQPIRPARE
jgi:hypothetical protein